jgi:hypothetical protein
MGDPARRYIGGRDDASFAPLFTPPIKSTGRVGRRNFDVAGRAAFIQPEPETVARPYPSQADPH